jgi:hypothetical protein
VHSIKIPVDGQNMALKPQWALVLQYEHRLRREACKLVNRGEATLAEALQRVIKDADLKESFFTTPLALTAAETPAKFSRSSFKGSSDSNYDATGRTKGKGKKKFQPWKGHGKGQKGHSKGKHGDLPLVSQTPDGRDICFAFNRAATTSVGDCMSAESVVVTATMRPESTAKCKRAGVRKSDPLGPCSPGVSYGCCISFAATKEKLTSNIFCMSLAN